MLNVVFAGSPDCAVPALEAVAKTHRVVAVLTNPASAKGRSRELIPTPVEAAARKLIAEGIIPANAPVLTPAKITDEVRAAIADTKPDALACFAYGKIFGPKTLALFSLGALNLHPSLLPRWRGCAPVPAAILARDAETGITVQKMALEMDAGDVVLQTKLPLDGTETADSLLDRAARDGAPMLAHALDLLERGEASGTRQNGANATFCSMLKKEDGEIGWNESAASIDAKIRAFTSWPGAFTQANGGQTLLILKASAWRGDEKTIQAAADAEPGTVLGIDRNAGILVRTGDGILAVEKLQWQTKKPLDWKSFLNGSRDFINSRLG